MGWVEFLTSQVKLNSGLIDVVNTIWIVQILFDFAVALAIFQWMLSRKRLQRLEDALRRIQIDKLAPSAAHDTTAASTALDLEPEVAVPSAEPIVAKPATLPATKTRQSISAAFAFNANSQIGNISQGAQVQSVATGFSNLTEKQIKPETRPARPTSRNSAEAFALAERLLAQGFTPQQVSEKTGLSQSELQLLGKVTQQQNNY